MVRCKDLGAVAQFGRAIALQAIGHEFDPRRLHNRAGGVVSKAEPFDPPQLHSGVEGKDGGKNKICEINFISPIALIFEGLR